MAGNGSIPTTSYAVLGLLGLGQMSGYDLVRLVEQTIAHFWTINKSHVYRELARLEEAGYVRSTSVPQERLPDKRIFKQTAAGRKALIGWLNAPDYEPDRYRSELLVKLFFASEMDPQNLKNMLKDYRERAVESRDQFVRIVDGLASSPENAFFRATALMGLRSYQASIAWVDEISKALQIERTKR
jgi:DNA-binding PadR family transcriptional regulator